MSTEQSSDLPPDAGDTSKGMSLLEVLVALAILAVALVGLTAGIIVASTATSRSSLRTQMAEFAQSRLERFTAASRKDMCSSTTPQSSGLVDCSKMAQTGDGGAFDVNGPPNSSGWMVDVLDRANSMQADAGVDQMAGPLLVLSDVGTINEATTVVRRNDLIAEGTTYGCASSIVTGPGPAGDGGVVLCREVHIESVNLLGDAGPGFHVWVRVVRGSRWQDGPVVLEEVIAQ